MSRNPTARSASLALGACVLAAVTTAGCGGQGARPGGAASADVQHFRSRPDLRPPTITVTTATPGAAPGDLFVAPKLGPGQWGPLILDGHGRTVWFHPVPKGQSAADFRVQRYRGRPVLTWWQGTVAKGYGHGEDLIYDDRYRQVAVVHAGNGQQADLHEFLLTDRDTALILTYHQVRHDLSSVGGPGDGTVLDCDVQEIDVKSGRVAFDWSTLAHVSLRESYSPVPKDGAPYDPFHLNSVAVMPDGSLLLSARNTWAVYDVSRRTGRIIWRLDGRRSDFHMGRGTPIAWQHDARPHADGTITIFDNGSSPKVHPQSRGVRIRLDLRARTATLVREYVHHPAIVADNQGNLQTLPDGDVFVGWGNNPEFTELTPDSAVAFEARFPPADQTYRAYRFAWSGQPTTPVDVAVERSRASAPPTLFVSWNGATGVASWQVLAGASAATLAPLETVPRTGFETAIGMPSGARHVVVRALAADGRVLASSTLRPHALA